MRFSELASAFEQIEKVTSTIAMRDILSSFFKKVPKGEVGMVCNLMEGQIASPYEGITLGLAEKMALKAVANAYHAPEARISSAFKKQGDVGLVAERFATARKPSLTIPEVFKRLHEIATASGTGSQDVKVKMLGKLLGQSTPLEARYISRIVVGQLRLGAGIMTILDSLAIAYLGGRDKRVELEAAYNICPDIGFIATLAHTKGLAGIRSIDIQVGRPIKMMLASRVDSIQEIKDHMTRICAEEKYDGERIQAHFDGKRIVLFSRRLDVITEQFPDVVEALRTCIRAKRYVIEGECCAVDSTGHLEPFQKLMQRRRKHEVEAYAKKIPITLFLFDLLYLNGTTYLEKPLLARKKALEGILTKKSSRLKLASHIVTGDIEKVEEFFNASLEEGCEGIIAKDATDQSVYQPGTRGWLWIKWKREYSTALRDTFDLVVVGAYRGRGKRSSTWGSLLCASYNDKKDQYETLCKLGSGFTDEELAKLQKRIGRYQATTKPANVSAKKTQEPDIWFKPVQVLEVLGAELTRSPTHTCAEKDGKGLALRFPRFIRWRDDKDPEQATTSADIQRMAKGR